MKILVACKEFSEVKYFNRFTIYLACDRFGGARVQLRQFSKLMRTVALSLGNIYNVCCVAQLVKCELWVTTAVLVAVHHLERVKWGQLVPADLDVDLLSVTVVNHGKV